MGYMRKLCNQVGSCFHQARQRWGKVCTEHRGSLQPDPRWELAGFACDPLQLGKVSVERSEAPLQVSPQNFQGCGSKVAA